MLLLLTFFVVVVSLGIPVLSSFFFLFFFAVSESDINKVVISNVGYPHLPFWLSESV